MDKNTFGSYYAKLEREQTLPAYSELTKNSLKEIFAVDPRSYTLDDFFSDYQSVLTPRSRAESRDFFSKVKEARTKERGFSSTVLMTDKDHVVVLRIPDLVEVKMSDREVSIDDLLDYEVDDEFEVLDLSNFLLSKPLSLEFVNDFLKEKDARDKCRLLDLSGNRLAPNCWPALLNLLNDHKELQIDVSVNPLASTDNAPNFKDFSDWTRLIWIPRLSWLEAEHWKKCLSQTQKESFPAAIIVKTHKTYFESTYFKQNK